MNGLREAEHSYSKKEAPDMSVDWDLVISRPPTFVTDAQVEQFIVELVENCTYPDELGMHRNPPALHIATARMWVQDKSTLPGDIGPSFWRWAKSAAQIAQFGK